MIRIYLRSLLQDKDLMQSELSRKTSIREATISEMCNNRIARINLKHHSKICEVLGCEVHDILEYRPDKD